MSAVGRERERERRKEAILRIQMLPIGSTRSYLSIYLSIYQMLSRTIARRLLDILRIWKSQCRCYDNGPRVSLVENQAILHVNACNQLFPQKNSSIAALIQVPTAIVAPILALCAMTSLVTQARIASA